MAGNDFESTQSWSLLAAHLEEFLEQWESESQPPTISSYLPVEPPDLRSMVLLELVKADIEYRRQKNIAVKPLEEYAVEHREFGGKSQLPVELIFEEYQVRRRAGEDVSPEVYFKRFPQQADKLRQLIYINSPNATQSLGAAPASIEIGPNDTIEDFELITELGKGSFATVYLAKQISMQRLVALKISADRGSEHQTLAQLDHPNIVRVYDVRTDAERGWRLLYMQHIGGGTLEDVIKSVKDVPTAERSGQLVLDSIDAALERAGQSPPVGAALRKRLAESNWPEAVCRIGIQLARALHYAHHKGGTLHRDVKPANVLLAGDAAPKLADFNISFSEQLEGSAPAAYFGGSLAYMSPEQLEACHPRHPTKPQDLDGRSDLYSLAVMLWEMLHGTRPFNDVKAGWTTMLVQLSTLRRNGEIEMTPTTDPLTLHLRSVLLRCMAPDAENRFPDGESLARELELCLQPEAAHLLEIKQTGWRELAGRYPIFSAIGIAATVPNLIASAFNTTYNLQAIIRTLPSVGYEGAELVFWRLQISINSIFFPIGIGIYIWYIWPVVQALREAFLARTKDASIVFAEQSAKRAALIHSLKTESTLDSAETEAVAGSDFDHADETVANSVEVKTALSVQPPPIAAQVVAETPTYRSNLSSDAIRLRTLYLGDIGAMICVTAWMIAGVSFPAVMHIFVGRFPAIQYIHFFVSVALCGMISGVYPFFFVTLVSVRCFYTALLRNDLHTSAIDAKALKSLDRRCGLYLLAAGIVPAIGVLATVIEQAIGFSNTELAEAAGSNSTHTAALIFLSCLGLFGFAAAYVISGTIQRDLRALRQFVAPGEED